MRVDLDTGKYNVVISSSNFDVSIESGAKLDVNIGKSARIDVNSAVTYIKSGKKEIDTYVEGKVKPDILEYSKIESQKFIDSYVGSTVEEYVEEVTKPSINEYTDTKISEFNKNAVSKSDDFSTLAESLTNEYTSLAQTSEEALIQYVDSASLSAKNAKDSADVSTAQASISTAQAVISTTKASESLASANASANSAKQCQAIKDSLGTVYVFKGSVANASSLPTNAKVGDVYDVQDSGNNYAWTGSSWDSLGVNVDLSNYVDINSEQTISGKKKFTQPLTIQNGEGTGSLWIGGNVNSGNLSNKNRHIARISVPSYNDITKATTMLGFDSSGDNTLSVANNNYDTLSFGGQKKITNATSPMAIGFCVTKTRESTAATDKVIPLEMDANEVRFNVKPNYNGTDLATDTDISSLQATKQDKLTAGTGISIVNNVISNTQTSAEWGNIQGTLSNQTDLQNALNGKANLNLGNSTVITNCITEIPQDIKLELKDGVLTLKAGSKLYVPNGKTEQKYYKYDNSNNPINLADSDNTNLITDGVISTGDRYNWNSTQTYNLNSHLNANKIYVNIKTTQCQANAQISVRATAITNNGNVEIYSNTYGYGVLPNETIEYTLPSGTITRGFEIFVQSWARSGKNCYATFSVGVSSNKSYESTSSDYDYVVEAGQNVFDVINIENDITVNTASSTGSFMVMYNGSFFRNQLVGSCYSGDTQPSVSSQYVAWYDTANNIIKITNDKGATWTGGLSLPICLTTVSGTTLTSVDQVFNGFGYIGSTWFALPNVRGSIPNGRNADGTYKVINATINEVKIQTLTSVDSTTRYMLLGDNHAGYWTTGAVEYKQDENLLYIDGQVKARLTAGTFVCTDGKITSFTPKLTFGAVDYNDRETIVDWGMPDYTAGVSKSKSGFTADKSGWIYCTTNVNQSTQYVYINGASAYRFGNNGYTDYGGMTIPVCKNDVITTTSGITEIIFYPCKGVN